MTRMITLYVIYNHPRDFPAHWVVRAQHVERPGVSYGDATIADTLEQARALLPPGLTNIGRFAEDDPAIQEVWI